MRSAINIKNYHAPETKREEESVACKSESKGDRAEIGGLKTNGASKSQKRFDLPDRRHWRVSRRLRSDDGIIESVAAKERDGLCDCATSRSDSRESIADSPEQSDADAGA